MGREGSAHGVQVVASPVPCRGLVRCGVVAASKNEELFSFGLTKIKTFARDAGLLLPVTAALCWSQHHVRSGLQDQIDVINMSVAF